jgi:hypothetical protein
MRRERRVNEVIIYEEATEERYLGTNMLFKWFAFGVFALLMMVLMIFIRYETKLNEPYHPTGVDLTYQDMQVVAEWRETAIRYNMFNDNPLIPLVKYFILAKLFLYGLQLVTCVICYFVDRALKNGISNYLAITSGNRLRFDYTGKLLVYRDEEGSLNKYRIIRDLLILGLNIILLAMFVCFGYMIGGDIV